MQIHRCLCVFLALSSAFAQELVVPPPAPEAVSLEAQSGSLAEQNQLLQELLELYATNAITPGEYQRRRAQLLGRDKPQADPWDRSSVRSSNIRRIAQPAAQGTAPAVRAAGIAVAEEASALLEGGLLPSVVPAGAKHFQAAIVPGADLFIQIDLQGARQSPIYDTLNKLNQPGELGPAADLMKNKELLEQFQQHLGLTDDDVQRVIISADLDKLQMGGDPGSMGSLPVMIGVQVAKDVSLEQIKSAVAAAMEGSDTKVEVAEAKIGSTDALVLRSQDPADPRVHLTVLGGKTILIGLNRPSLTGALGRAEATPSALSSAIMESQRSLPGAAQFKLVFVVPQSLRNMLGAMAAPPEGAGGAGAPAAGGMGPAGMLGGLKDLRSISLGVALAQGITAQFSGDLGRPEAADGVNMLVQLMKPQLMASLAEQLGKPPGQLSPDLVNSRTKGSVIDISVSLSKELIESLAAE